jgi:metal-sulfur cluster biosynthetic enzyme
MGSMTIAGSESRLSEVQIVLRGVLDPHFGVSLEDMGMVADIEEDDGVVTIQLVLPCLGCPAWDDIQLSVEEGVGRVNGVKEVKVVTNWEVAWSVASMSGTAKSLIGSYGVKL